MYRPKGGWPDIETIFTAVESATDRAAQDVAFALGPRIRYADEHVLASMMYHKMEHRLARMIGARVEEFDVRLPNGARVGPDRSHEPRWRASARLASSSLSGASEATLDDTFMRRMVVALAAAIREGASASELAEVARRIVAEEVQSTLSLGRSSV